MSKISIGIMDVATLAGALKWRPAESGYAADGDLYPAGPGEMGEASAPFVSVKDMAQYVGKIDVMMLCGGSATDLPQQGPEAAKLFNTVDSFDTHAKIPEYFSAVDEAAERPDT